MFAALPEVRRERTLARVIEEARLDGWHMNAATLALPRELRQLTKRYIAWKSLEQSGLSIRVLDELQSASGWLGGASTAVLDVDHRRLEDAVGGHAGTVHRRSGASVRRVDGRA